MSPHPFPDTPTLAAFSEACEREARRIDPQAYRKPPIVSEANPAQQKLGLALLRWDAAACAQAQLEGANPRAPWRGEALSSHWLASMATEEGRGTLSGRAADTLLWLDSQGGFITRSGPAGSRENWGAVAQEDQLPTGKELAKARKETLANMFVHFNYAETLPSFAKVARAWAADPDVDARVPLSRWPELILETGTADRYNFDRFLSAAISLGELLEVGAPLDFWSATLRRLASAPHSQARSLATLSRAFGAIDPSWPAAIANDALICAIIDDNIPLIEMLGSTLSPMPGLLDCSRMHKRIAERSDVKIPKKPLLSALALSLVGCKGPSGKIEDWSASAAFETLLSIPEVVQAAIAQPDSSIFAHCSVNLIRGVKARLPELLEPDAEGKTFAHQWATEPCVSGLTEGPERLAKLMTSDLKYYALCEDAQGQTAVALALGRKDLSTRVIATLEKAVATMEAKEIRSDSVGKATRKKAGSRSRL